MRIGIIGCGTIAATYFQSLERLTGLYEVTALYDILPEKSRAYAFSEKMICGSVGELASRADVDCVVISTPAHTHCAIAEQCLRRKKHVLMEKPAAMRLSEIRKLYDLAQEMGVVFHVAFHSSFGIDIDWYLETLGRADSPYNIGNIRQAECRFYDPYIIDGVMLEDRKALGGSYIDSGVNILSVCSRLVPLEGFRLCSHDAKKVPDGVVYASETVFAHRDVRLVLHTGWDKGMNHKSTLLCFHGTDHMILLDHTGQAVWQITPKGEKQLLFLENRTSRMVNQYVRVFRVFAEVVASGSQGEYQRQAMQVHRLLLCV